MIRFGNAFTPREGADGLYHLCPILLIKSLRFKIPQIGVSRSYSVPNYLDGQLENVKTDKIPFKWLADSNTVVVGAALGHLIVNNDIIDTT